MTPGTAEVNVAGKKAIISIRGLITSDMANLLIAQLDSILSKGITEAFVKLSSPGGSVFAAGDIGNTFKKFKTINGELGIVAASATSYLVAVIRKMGGSVSAPSNGHTMFHKPCTAAEGNEKDIESSLKLITSLTQEYRSTYAAVMNKTEDEVEQMWASDYWANASESKDLGFITDIRGAEDVSQELADVLAAAGIDVQATIKTPIKDQSNDKNKMDKLEIVAAALELEPTATATEVIASIKAIKARNTELEGVNAALTTEVTAAKAAKVKTLVDGAVSANKITEAERASYEKLATQDYDSVSAIIGGLKPHVPFTKSQTADPKAASRADWDYEKYQKEDPKALEKMMNDTPDVFAKLKEEYVKKLKG